MSGNIWLPAGARESREAACPDLCSHIVRGFYGAITWCGQPANHDGDCSPFGKNPEAGQ